MYGTYTFRVACFRVPFVVKLSFCGDMLSAESLQQVCLYRSPVLQLHFVSNSCGSYVYNSTFVLVTFILHCLHSIYFYALMTFQHSCF